MGTRVRKYTRVIRRIVITITIFLLASGFLWSSKSLNIDKAISHLISQNQKAVKRELGHLIFYEETKDLLDHAEELKPVLIKLLNHQDVFIRVASAELLWRVFDDDRGGMEIVNALTGDNREAELFALFSIFRLGEKPVDLLLRENNWNDGKLGRTDLALKHYRMKKITDRLIQHLKYPNTHERYKNFDYIFERVQTFPTEEARRRIRNIIILVINKKEDRNKQEDSIWAGSKGLLMDHTALKVKVLETLIEGLRSWRKVKLFFYTSWGCALANPLRIKGFVSRKAEMWCHRIA